MRFFVAAIVLLVSLPVSASADVQPRSDDKRNALYVKVRTVEEIGTTKAPSPRAVVAQPAPPARARVTYDYRTACDSGAYNSVTGAAVCPADPCPAGSTQYRQWEVSASGERPMGFVCSGSGPPAAVAAAAAPPQVTDAMVLAAFRRIPVPELRSISQPDDTTLVNFDTIFHVQADGFTETVTLLGQRVRLEIEPSSFRWEHGDGTSATTSTPGAAYPSKEVVHRYQDAHVTVRHRVVVTWTAQWSLNGGPLRPVSGTVTTTGPTTALRVAEAVPALSGQR